MVNSRAKPGRELRDLVSKETPFVALSGGELVAARVTLGQIAPGVITRKKVAAISKKVERLEVPRDMLFKGYWELVANNGMAIASQAGYFADSLALSDSTKLRGPPSNLRIHGSAEVEDYVAFDVKLGPVVVGEEATIESFSRISGPCYIGPRTKVTSGLLRAGTSIFEGCKVGGEVENSIMMPHSNKAHLGYVGDSYIGEWVNLGAGSVFSNLKNTYGNVRTDVGGRRLDTGMMKLGPAIGDMAKVSIGATIFAGKKVGVGSHVTGLVDADVPSFTYFDGERGRIVELLLSSVIETQRRMKERRGLTLSREEEELIRGVFRRTAGDRRKGKARKQRL